MRESQKRATKKWINENYEQISIRVRKGTRDQIKGWAEDDGISLAEYIKQACIEKRERR